MEQVERLNTVVYWLTYSRLEPFTVKPKTAEDLKPIDERVAVQKCGLCPAPDETAVPPDLGPGGYVYAIQELIRLHQPDLASLIANATGGRTLSGKPGEFHKIRVEVSARPELRAKTRAGYWTLR